MIFDVLIGLVAVVVLIAIIGGLAVHYLRGDDDDPVLVLQDDNPAADTHGAALVGTVEPAVISPGLRLLPAVMDSEGEPADGDAYAAELHAIGQAAAADVLELHTDWVAVLAMRRQVLRNARPDLYRASRTYWAGRRREWKQETLDWWADYRVWRQEMGLAA